MNIAGVSLLSWALIGFILGLAFTLGARVMNGIISLLV